MDGREEEKERTPHRWIHKAVGPTKSWSSQTFFFFASPVKMEDEVVRNRARED